MAHGEVVMQVKKGEVSVDDLVEVVSRGRLRSEEDEIADVPKLGA
jgi:hypothetical protein